MEVQALNILLNNSPTAVMLLVAWWIWNNRRYKGENRRENLDGGAVTCFKHDTEIEVLKVDAKERNDEIQEFKREVRGDIDRIERMIEDRLDKGFQRIHERIDKMMDRGE